MRDRIVAEALSWMGTPYHHRARLKGAGVDCAQILIAVFVAVGLVDDFDPGDYPPDWMMHRDEERYLGFVGRHAEQVEEPLPGDVVLYRVGRCYSHAGIVLGWPEIVHASNRDGEVVRADGRQGWLSDRQRTYWRVRGVSA